MWFKFKKSFGFKLVFSYIFIILVSFGFIAFYLSKNLEEHSLQDLKSSLVNQAYLIESQISLEKLKNEDLSYLNALTSALSQKIECRLSIIDKQGKVLADSERLIAQIPKMENHAKRPEVKLALEGSLGEATRYSATLKINMLYIALPILDNNETLGAIRLALPLENVQRMLLATRKAILLSLIIAIGLAFILGYILASGIMKSIHKIAYVSHKFSQGDFNHRISLNSGDEIEELANTLNKMAKSLEDKIKEVEIQNQHLKAILETMVEGIIVVDKLSQILSANPAAERIFNITLQGSKGKFFLEAIPNDTIAEIISRVLEGGKFTSGEIDLVWPRQKIFKIDASPIFAKDAVTACLLVVHDITEIRKLETMRRDFVANVSHELKTPLTSIKGFVETLLEGALEDKENSKHFLQIIQDHANRLDSLINDLLDLSSLESRETGLNIKEVDLKILADNILLGFRSQLKKKNVNAKNDLSEGLIAKVDKNKINQVLTNLIDNAIKFNRENGTIKIYGEDSLDTMKIFIEDSGIGIPVKDIPRIFERFYRVDKARSRELGGTGLGLSIVKHIIELHGGTVAVESQEGFGSKFSLTLPK